MAATYETLKDEIVALTEALYASDPSKFGSLRSSLGDVGSGPVYNTVQLGSGNSALVFMVGSAWGPAVDRTNPAAGPDPARLDKTVIATLLQGVVNFISQESVTLVIAPFAFSNGAVTHVLTLEEDDIVPLTQVVVETVFNSVGAQIAVGTSVNPTAIFSGGEVDLEVAGTYVNDEVVSADSTQFLQFDVDPAGATTGSGFIVFWVKRSPGGG